jgi:hypothetical protein
MSDNIDYNELDRAVKAATAAKAESKSAERERSNVVKKTTPVKRPASRGVVMDFAPRRIAHTKRVVVAKTVAVNAPKPTLAPALAQKPVLAKKKPVTAPINRLINRPAAKTEPKTVAKPTVAAARPISKPVIRPAAKPAPKPVAHAPKPALAPAPARPQAAHPTASRVEHQRPAAKPTPETAPAPAIKRREAPNANNYSLGGRSPFMTNTHVEKRPLGANIPETSASALRSTRNVYSQKSPTRATENAQKHVIAQEPGKKSGWLWTLIVIAVIAAGGGLGYLAYLLIFAH